MAQAKTLTQAEIDQVLRYVAGTRYQQRNRTMVLASVWSGMRVGEIAALRVGDVRNEDGTIKNEIRLSAQQTKGNYGRVVFVNDKLRTELSVYLRSFAQRPSTHPLFLRSSQRVSQQTR